MSRLFSPLTIKSVKFRNRIVVSPMCQYSAVDGYANDWHLVHLGSRAVGGAGLVIQEATAVSPEGRITAGDLGIYYHDHVEKLKQITAFIQAQGAVAGIQIAHAGRKASCDLPWNGGGQLKKDEGGWPTVSSSPLTFNPDDEAPSELTLKELKKVVNDFKVAAARAFEAGYQVLEIHAAHGYLIHQFFSPLSNKRSDKFGGSFVNRIRLCMEIIAAVQAVWPKELPLFVRISATDWADHGWDLTEALQLCAILKSLGVDLIDCSSGGLVKHQQIPLGPGYQVPFSAKIRSKTGILTGTVGLITEPSQSEEILKNGEADLILIGRESLREPYFTLKAAKELGDELSWPNQYARAKL